MSVEAEYTGTHKVVLPLDYMNSVEAVCDLHEESIAEAALSLDIPELRTSVLQRLLKFSIAGALLWLIPANM
ncbi:MAG: hypothetical protein HKN81_11295 [Gammaproteobacteria bacterium]|nr:hypothetical protein [Gammaproteobacteria bacterium]NND37705.1 hypothetical protein [Gammaproteobacteria bacterium]